MIWYELVPKRGNEIMPMAMSSILAVLVGRLGIFEKLRLQIVFIDGFVVMRIGCPTRLVGLLKGQVGSYYLGAKLVEVGNLPVKWKKCFWNSESKLVGEFTERVTGEFIDPMIGVFAVLNNGGGCQILVDHTGRIKLFVAGVKEQRRRLLAALGQVFIGIRACYWHFWSKASLDVVALMFHSPVNIIGGVKYNESLGIGNLPNLLKTAGDLDVKFAFCNDGDVGLLEADRRRHTYIVGKTGMGKSTILKSMVYEDMLAGRGVCVIDPHGDLVEDLLSLLPKSRMNDLIYFDPADSEHPLSFNILDCLNEQKFLVASGLVSVFKKLYANSWGPRLEYILRNTVLSLLEMPGANMLWILRLLQDEKFRDKLVTNIGDPVLKSYWLGEFGKMHEKQRVEAIAPIQNKVGQFLANPVVRNILGQQKSTLDIRFAMDTNKIVLVNLSKGKLGEDNSALLGAMLVTKIQLAAMSRCDLSIDDRKDFYLYVDEFQNFATDSFGSILSEARKYKLNLIVANQYLSQLNEEIRDAVLGNIGNLIVFQVGAEDAMLIEKEFSEEIAANDLTKLNQFHFVGKLLVNGCSTEPFVAGVKKVFDMPNIERANKARIVSRQRYNSSRDKVERQISRMLAIST